MQRLIHKPFLMVILGNLEEMKGNDPMVIYLEGLILLSEV